MIKESVEKFYAFFSYLGVLTFGDKNGILTVEKEMGIEYGSCRKEIQ